MGNQTVVAARRLVALAMVLTMSLHSLSAAAQQSNGVLFNASVLASNANVTQMQINASGTFNIPTSRFVIVGGPTASPVNASLMWVQFYFNGSTPAASGPSSSGASSSPQYNGQQIAYTNDQLGYLLMAMRPFDRWYLLGIVDLIPSQSVPVANWVPLSWSYPLWPIAGLPSGFAPALRAWLPGSAADTVTTQTTTGTTGSASTTTMTVQAATISSTSFTGWSFGSSSFYYSGWVVQAFLATFASVVGSLLLPSSSLGGGATTVPPFTVPPSLSASVVPCPAAGCNVPLLVNVTLPGVAPLNVTNATTTTAAILSLINSLLPPTPAAVGGPSASMLPPPVTVVSIISPSVVQLRVVGEANLAAVYRLASPPSRTEAPLVDQATRQRIVIGVAVVVALLGALSIVVTCQRNFAGSRRKAIEPKSEALREAMVGG